MIEELKNFQKDIRVRFHRNGHVVTGMIGYILQSNCDGTFVVGVPLDDGSNRYSVTIITNVKPEEVEPC